MQHGLALVCSLAEKKGKEMGLLLESEISEKKRELRVLCKGRKIIELLHLCFILNEPRQMNTTTSLLLKWFFFPLFDGLLEKGRDIHNLTTLTN